MFTGKVAVLTFQELREFAIKFHARCLCRYEDVVKMLTDGINLLPFANKPDDENVVSALLELIGDSGYCDFIAIELDADLVLFENSGHFAKGEPEVVFDIRNKSPEDLKHFVELREKHKGNVPCMKKATVHFENGDQQQLQIKVWPDGGWNIPYQEILEKQTV